MARSPGVLGTLLTFGMSGAMLLNWRGVCEFAGGGLRFEIVRIVRCIRDDSEDWLDRNFRVNSRKIMRATDRCD